MKTVQQIAQSTETSNEIIQAIANQCGENEVDILQQWQEPCNMNGIIESAIILAKNDPKNDEEINLFWGTEGLVYTNK